MEVEDRIDEDEGTLDLNDVKFEMKVEDERLQRDDEEDFMYENPNLCYQSPHNFVKTLVSSNTNRVILDSHELNAVSTVSL